MEDKNKKIYNLEERTIRFGKNIVRFCKSVKQSPVTNPIIIQLVRSGTSIGANYMEANGASSKKDFKNKIYICKKEAQETKYWLRIIESSIPEHKEEVKKLWDEAQQFSMIFGKIVSTMNESGAKSK